jgi:hypothetical protein
MRTRVILVPHSSNKTDLNLKPGPAQVAVTDIRLRKADSTRPLAALHVATLVESIATLGLLEPVVIDTDGHLLAGGHRLAALQLLADPLPIARRKTFLARCGHKAPNEAPTGELAGLADRVAMANGEAFIERYAKARIPVQVVDVSGKDGADLALAIEAAENTVRRQYTRDEIVALAERFKKAGYKAQETGRPKKGEKTVMTALEAALGRSKRQIQRILEDSDGAKGKSEWQKAKAALIRAAKRIVETGGRQKANESKALIKAAEAALKVAGEDGAE